MSLTAELQGGTTLTILKLHALTREIQSQKNLVAVLIHVQREKKNSITNILLNINNILNYITAKK